MHLLAVAILAFLFLHLISASGTVRGRKANWLDATISFTFVGLSVALAVASL